jgi:hypothetical protein
MSNLMVYPAEIAEMSVNQLAALPNAKLVEATTNLDELLKWAKENRQKLDAAMEMRFGGQGRGALNESGRDFGTVHFNDGPLSVSYDLPKRVSWDQAKLKEIAERIVAAGEPLSEYIDVEFSVSEKRFSAWPTNMKEQFVQARTVKGGKPAIRVEFNGVEVQ